MAYRIDRKTEIVIGHEGENNARRVTFDVSGYPEGTVILEHLRYGSAYPYPITLDRDGDVAAWTITDVDTSRRGTGRGQLVVIDADKNIVYKSDVFKVINRFSLSSTDAPDGWESWIERLELMGADLVAMRDLSLAEIDAKKIEGIDAVGGAVRTGIAEVDSAKTDGLNAIHEARDSALNRISTVSADGIEAVNTAKTDSLDAIEQKKEAVHTELDGYVAEHHDALKGEKGDDYIITEADKQEIADEVESKYVTELGEIKEDLSQVSESITDISYRYFSDFGGEIEQHISYDSNMLPNPNGTFYTDTSISNRAWYGSGYVEIPENAKSIRYRAIQYSATLITPIAFYDENKTFITCVPFNTQGDAFKIVTGEVFIPTGAKYMYQSQFYQEGDRRNSNNYTVFVMSAKYNLSDIEKSVNSWKGVIGEKDKLYGLPYYDDNSIYMSDGNIKTFSGWKSSGFVPCDGASIEYCAYSFYDGRSNIDVAYVSFFDENHTFIGCLKSSDTTNGKKEGFVQPPSNCKYVKGVSAGGTEPYIVVKGYGLLMEENIHNGMTVCCVGDSLTQGVDVASHVIKESYPYFMSKYIGCNVLNYGQKGRSPKTWWDNYINTYSFDSSIDVVLIMFGTNGGLNRNTLSTDVEPYADWHNYADTDVGVFCKLIEYITEQTEHHAQIILLTPPYSTYTEAQEQLVKDTNPVIKAIAERYSLPVIDILNECGMGKFNGNIFRPHDGCHFNAKGYHRLGTFIGSKVKSMVSTWSDNDVYDDETSPT